MRRAKALWKLRVRGRAVGVNLSHLHPLGCLISNTHKNTALIFLKLI
jgi:hypothetical protein